MTDARVKRGWSQEDLAKAARVCLSTVTRTELAMTNPRTPEAQRMAMKLGLSVEALLEVIELVRAKRPLAKRQPLARTKPREKARTGTHG